MPRCVSRALPSPATGAESSRLRARMGAAVRGQHTCARPAVETRKASDANAHADVGGADRARGCIGRAGGACPQPLRWSEQPDGTQRAVVWRASGGAKADVTDAAAQLDGRCGGRDAFARTRRARAVAHHWFVRRDRADCTQACTCTHARSTRAEVGLARERVRAKSARQKPGTYRHKARRRTLGILASRCIASDRCWLGRWCC